MSGLNSLQSDRRMLKNHQSGMGLFLSLKKKVIENSSGSFLLLARKSRKLWSLGRQENEFCYFLGRADVSRNVHHIQYAVIFE